jgi:general secretion pathway protein A
VTILLDHADRIGSDAVEAVRRLFALDRAASGGLTIICATRDAGTSPLSKLRDLFDLRVELRPLDRDETQQYVEHRMALAGSTRETFDAAAFDAIFERTGGIPRTIDRLCDLALLAGMVERAASVTADIVATAGVELLPPSSSAPSSLVST